MKFLVWSENDIEENAEKIWSSSAMYAAEEFVTDHHASYYDYAIVCRCYVKSPGQIGNDFYRVSVEQTPVFHATKIEG